MAKQTRTLTALATAIVSHTNAGMAHAESRRALLEKCALLAAPEKARVDAELVNYYAAQAGVDVKAREKGEAAEGRCSLVACWAKKDDGKLTDKSNKASVALSRARSVLFGVEKGNAKKSEKGTAQERTFAGLEKLAAEAVKAGDKRQIKEMKQRVTAVLLMLAG